MASLAEIRSQYPQYADMPDAALADALHKKFYADMPRGDFDKKLGIAAPPETPPPPGIPATGPVTLSDVGASAWNDVKKAGSGLLNALTAPKRLVEAATSAPVGSRELTENMVGPAMESAMLVSPVNPAVRAGDRAIAGMARRPMQQEAAAVPSAETLLQTGGRQIQSAREMPVDFNASAMQRIAQELQRDLSNRGIREQHAPDTYAFIRQMENPPPGSFSTFGDFMAAREAFGNSAAPNINRPREPLAASRAIAAIDEFLANPGAADIVAGPAAEASAAYRAGRGNYAAGKRSETLTGKEDRADLAAAVANSGQNIGNQLRQRLAEILNRPKEARGFTDAELAQIEGVAAGGPVANATRYAGNLLGGGGGLGMALTGGMGATAGAMAGGPVGAAVGATVPAVTGALLKRVSNALTRRGIHSVDEATRMRSPLYDEAVAGGQFSPATPEGMAAIARLLLATQGQHNAP